MNKKFAFTLSEVLVTLAIIGVISALTVPTLVNGYQKKAYSVQLRKTVLDITNAFDMYLTEEGKAKLSATGAFKKQADLNTFIKEHFKIINTCSSTETGICFAANYNKIDGGSATYSCSGDSFVLGSSAAVCMTLAEDKSYITIQVDTNGTEGPNVGGRDMFVAYLRPDGQIYPCTSGECTNALATCTGSNIGSQCYGLLLESNWDMTY